MHFRQRYAHEWNHATKKTSTRVSLQKRCVGQVWIFSYHIEKGRPVLHSRCRKECHRLSFMPQYSWIGPPVDAQTKTICQQTERATTNPRSRTKSNWREQSRSAWSIFVWFTLTSFFKMTFQITSKQKDQEKLDSPRQTLQYWGLRSFGSALVCWKIDFLVSLRKSS